MTDSTQQARAAVTPEAIEAAAVDRAIANFYITVGDNLPRRMVGKSLIHNGGKS